MKQAIADETKQGKAAKAYIEKGMMGRFLCAVQCVCVNNIRIPWFIQMLHWSISVQYLLVGSMQLTCEW